MGRNDLEDIAILVGLSIAGVIAYQKYFPGKSFEEVVTELDKSLRGFLDTIKLPALPEIPSITQPAAAAALPPPSVPQTSTPPPPSLPSSADETEPTQPAAEPTNTVPDETGPKVNDPPVKPKDSGQLKNNPVVSPPPSGSGGAIVAFAGDFDTNAKAKQTVDMMEKNNVSFIIGCGDYSYGPAAATWFNQIIGARYKGKMKGAIGNHDENSYLSTFGQTGWNFAHQVAPNLTVVFIDTESGITEPTLTSLTKSAKGQSKHVAYAMHKAYITSSDGHHPPSENKWGAIIDKVAKANGVKLVVAGHNHVMEHYFCNGIHYVTSGAAGRKFYTTGCKACSPVKCADNVNGFLKVSVGASLLCQFIDNKTGSPIDTFTIT